jgi:hypothetical protein
MKKPPRLYDRPRIALVENRHVDPLADQAAADATSAIMALLAKGCRTFLVVGYHDKREPEMVTTPELPGLQNGQLFLLYHSLGDMHSGDDT